MFGLINHILQQFIVLSGPQCRHRHYGCLNFHGESPRHLNILTGLQITNSLGRDYYRFGFLSLPKLVDFSLGKTDILLLIIFVKLTVVLK